MIFGSGEALQRGLPIVRSTDDASGVVALSSLLSASQYPAVYTTILH